MRYTKNIQIDLEQALTTNPQEHQHNEIQLAAIKEQIARLQLFFNNNSICTIVGMNLISDFIKLTKNGGAIILMERDNELVEPDNNSDPMLELYLAALQVLETGLTKEDYLVIDNLFSDNLTINNDYEDKDEDAAEDPVLRGAFLDALFGAGHEDNHSFVDGSVALIACLAIFLRTTDIAPGDDKSIH